MDRPPVSVLSEVLHNQFEPITKRMKALKYLRKIGTPDVIPILISSFNDPSLLLQHEICYVLGQINDKSAIEFLTSVLEDESAASISRHEAAEAIGAIGNPESIKLLEKHAQDLDPIVSDTCKLAISRLEWLKTGEVVEKSFNYAIDPAPPFDPEKSFEWLVDVYNNTDLSLFNRYRALFSLRNLETDEAVLEISKGLRNPNFSDLFQHEIGFVFTQMKKKAIKALPFLLETVKDTNLHYVIRHEATEAIGKMTNESVYLDVLREHENDPDEPVASSCKIVLDTSEYWFSTS